jgi:ferrochelatase
MGVSCFGAVYVRDGIQAHTYIARSSFPCPSRLNLSRTYAIRSLFGGRTGLCVGHCSHCKPLSCKCKLGWSSQPPPDSRQHVRPCSSASEAVLTAQSDIRKLFVANEKIGVLLLNLGGPETLDDVQPFLFNLFADPVITVLICNYDPLSFDTFCAFSLYFAKRLC